MRVALVQRQHEILNLLSKWRMMSFKEIKEIIYPNTTPTVLSRHLKQLIDMDVVKKVPKMPSNHGLYYLSSKGLRSGSVDGVELVNDEYIWHEIAVTSFIKQLKKFPQVKEVGFDRSMCGDFRDRTIEPDAVGVFQAKSGTVNVAIEIEINRKQKKRVVQKFKTYLESKNYGLVIYFFNSTDVYSAYKEMLDSHASWRGENSESDVLKKFMLIYAPTNECQVCDLSNEVCYYARRERMVKEVFGE